MLNATQTRLNPIYNPDVLGGSIALGIGAVLGIDQLQGTRARRELRPYPEFYTTQENTVGETLGFLPGCQVNGHSVFKRLLEHATNQNLVVAGYPERNFSIEQVCEGFGRELVKQGAEKPNIICQSMGSIVLRHLLEYARSTDLAERISGFGTIVLDDPIHDYADVSGKYRLLLKAATSTHNSWVIDKLKPTVMSKITGESNSLSNATHLETIASEGKFIIDAVHPNDNYDDLVESVIYIHGPAGDKVARTHQALRKYQANFPTKLIEFVDNSRAPGSHTANEAELDNMLQLANNSNNKNAV